MARIPPNLHPTVLKLAGDGNSGEAIAEVLWNAHQIRVSARSVQRLIERHRTEAVNLAKSVVAQALRRYLVPAVRRIVRVANRARRLERASHERAHSLRTEADGHPWHPLALKEDLLQLRAIDRQLKAADLLLVYSGLNEPDEQRWRQPAGTGPDARAALFERIAALLAASKAGAPAAEEPDAELAEPGPKKPPVH